MAGFAKSARMMYETLGFDTLPLLAGSKKPYASAWQKRLPIYLWQNAPDDANIGIRGGGFANVAFIDCDAPQTFEHVTNYLTGLGYRGDSYPLVQSASGHGWHIYITLKGFLTGDARSLSKEIGAGEVRYGCRRVCCCPTKFPPRWR